MRFIHLVFFASLTQMVSLCVFATHCSGPVPPNVFVFVRELARHFDRVIVSTTSTITATSFSNGIPGVETHVSENDSYDIGLFYKAWSSLTEKVREEVTRLGFVNDSNRILCKLDNVFAWGNANRADFWGLTDSVEMNYHIQSPFLVFEKNAIGFLTSFMEKCGVATVWPTIVDRRELRQKIINEFETKLTVYMITNGIQTAVYTPCVKMGIAGNATILNAILIVGLGHPMIKRQVPDADALVSRCLLDGELRGAEFARANAFWRNKT